MDLLLGGFANAALGALDDDELSSFEALLELPDHDVFAWLTGQAPLPPDQDTPFFRRLKRFHDHAHPINA
jgi:antitoxin CptB